MTYANVFSIVFLACIGLACFSSAFSAEPATAVVVTKIYFQYPFLNPESGLEKGEQGGEGSEKFLVAEAADAAERVFVKYGWWNQKQLAFPDSFEFDIAKVPPRILRVYDKLDTDVKQDIYNVHKRFWENYARIIQVRFYYSSSTTEYGKSIDSPMDMGANIDLQYGQGISAVGIDDQGEAFELSVNRKGKWDVRRKGSGDKGRGLALTLFHVMDAYPGHLPAFYSIRKHVAHPDKPAENRYSVLLIKSRDEVQPDKPCDNYFYYNEKTGMLDRREWGGEFYKEKYGRYASYDYEYARLGDVYVPTKIVMDRPGTGRRMVQTYNDIIVWVKEKQP